VIEAYENGKGLTLKRPADVRKILQRALEYNDGPCLINAEVVKTDNVFPMVPAGKPLEALLVEPPRANEKMEKPTGST